MIDEKVLIKEFKSMLNTMVVDADGTHTVSLEAVIAFIEMFPTIQLQGIDKDKLIELLNTDMSGCDGDFAEEMAEIIVANMQLPTPDVPDTNVGEMTQPYKDRLIEEITKIACRYCNPIKCEMLCIEDGTYICDHASMIGAILDIINQQPTSDGWIPVSSGERLTKIYKTKYVNCNRVNKTIDCNAFDDCGTCPHFITMREKLAYYEDLAEQGRLAFLPQLYKEGE